MYYNNRFYVAVGSMIEVLMYNIEDGKRLKIKLLCNKLNIRAREIDKSEFGLKLSTLLGLDDDTSVAPDSDFDDEMLYLSDFYGSMLNIFLNQLKRQKNPVALKAIKTDANIGFTSFELYKELCEEHRALNS